jgi:hypothetical protein
MPGRYRTSLMSQFSVPQLRSDFLSGSIGLAACLTEPEANKEDIELFTRRQLRILSLLSARPLTSASLHQLVASAAFFQEVALLTTLQQAGVVQALARLQSHTRAQALDLSETDVEDGCYRYPASRRFAVVYSWPDGGSVKALSVVPRVAVGGGVDDLDGPLEL